MDTKIIEDLNKRLIAIESTQNKQTELIKELEDKINEKRDILRQIENVMKPGFPKINTHLRFPKI